MRRSRAILAGLVITTILHTLAAAAFAAGAPPPPGAVSSSGASTGAGTAPDPALVRIVTAPGGISADMRAALKNLDALFARSPERVQSFSGPAGSRSLQLGAGFLNVYVARLDPDGKVRGACTSSLAEALRAMEPAKAPGTPKLDESRRALALEER